MHLRRMFRPRPRRFCAYADTTTVAGYYARGSVRLASHLPTISRLEPEHRQPFRGLPAMYPGFEPRRQAAAPELVQGTDR